MDNFFNCCLVLLSCYLVTKIINLVSITKHFFQLWITFFCCLVILFRYLVTNISNFIYICKHFFLYVGNFCILFPFLSIVNELVTNISNFHIINKHFFYFVRETEYIFFTLFPYHVK